MRKPPNEDTLEGMITILCRKEEANYTPKGVTIEITDTNSSIQFLEIHIDSAEFVAALGGLGYRPCKLVARGLEKLGLVHEHKTFEFETGDDNNCTRPTQEKLQELALEKCPEGWQPDLLFNSQGSFFVKDGKQYARTIIRRYVKPAV